MKTKALELSLVCCDSGTQSRLSINDDIVASYAERMTAGDTFPPLDVFFDGSHYHLGDGFHRCMAAHRIGLKKFECSIHSGTATDALWFALGANRSNGLHMSASDKRYAIQLALAKFPEKTQQQIAEHVGCAQSYVNRVKSELDNITGDNTKERKDSTGRNRPTKYKKRDAATEESAPAPEPPAPPAEPEPEAQEEAVRVRTSTEVLAEQAFGNLKATKIIKAFEAWMAMNFPQQDERDFALGLLSEHIANLTAQ